MNSTYSKISRFIFLLLILGQIVEAQESTRNFSGKLVLFGNLHAHSKLSDDVEGAGDEMLPVHAFEYADENGLDFLAVTDHHKATDANHRLWMMPQEYKQKLYDVAMEYNQSHVGEFIAVPGIEWGTTATGNHVNVFGLDRLPPNTISNAEYEELYDWVATNAEFMQFNHPSSWFGSDNRDSTVGNYGINKFGSAEEFCNSVNRKLGTVSVISTVHGGHISGKFRNSKDKSHRELSLPNFKEYLKLLDIGVRAAPAANQDTHGANWGTVTAARTGVWADTFDYSGLVDAIAKRRVYATEDDELAVAFRVRYGENEHWMGDNVLLSGAEAEIEVLINVWQVVSDELQDSPQEGPYMVSIWSDFDGPGGMLAEEWSIEETNASGVVELVVPVVAGEYFFVKVTEKNGSDNPIGDEEMPESKSGATPAEGNREQMNDSAWTAPIWFTLDGSD